MSCYTSHLTEPMRAVGLPDDRAGRREADRRIRARLGVPNADCPEIRRQLKALGSAAWLDLLRAPEPGTEAAARSEA